MNGIDQYFIHDLGTRALAIIAKCIDKKFSINLSNIGMRIV